MKNCNTSAREKSLGQLARELDGKLVVPRQRSVGANGSRRKKSVGARGNDEWYTPREILEPVRDVLDNIDLDPASCPEAQKRVRAARYFTKADNALEREWYGRTFLNPPFSRGKIGAFIDKLLVELQSGRVREAILLVNNCADTAWFGKAARAAALICFTRGRIRFIKPDGKKLGSPPQGQAFFYFGPDPEKFRARFRLIGLVGVLQKRKRPTRVYVPPCVRRGPGSGSGPSGAEMATASM